MAKLEGTQIIIIVIVVAFFILAYFKDIEVGYNIKLAGSMNRVFSSTNIPINNKITVTYNAPNTECTLEETLPNGWIADVTLYNHKFREDFGSNTIKTHQYSHVDNIASSYTFVGGQWWCPNGVWTSFPSVTVTTVACSPTTEICDNIDNDCDHETDENPTSICIAGSTCTSGTCIVNSALTSALWKDSTGTTTISSAYAGTNVMLAVSGIGFTGKTITYKIYNGNSLINTTSKLSSSDTSASLVWMVESNGTYTFNASLSSTSLIIHSGALTSPSERNVTGACNGSLLINATWNDNKTSGAGTYTYTQKWNISASIWQPVIVLNTEYNETIGDCNFKCPSEYLWDGTNCVQNIINNLYCTNFGTQSQCEDESNSAVSAAAKLTLDDNGEYCGAQNILDPNNLASTCYYNVNCNCVWDGTSCSNANANWNVISGTCPSGYSGNPGICSTSVKILEDNCNNPKNNRIIQVVATWTGNAYPINCNNQTVTYPCMSTATLSFFGVTQMIIGIFVVALIYLSYSFIRSKKQGI